MAEPLPRIELPAAPVRARPSPAPVIPFLEPELPSLELLFEDFQKIYRSKTYSNGGAFERELSARLSTYLQVPHCLPVGNATLGLMLAIKALAVPGKHKVLLPSFTFAATALAVEWCGLTPVFCDAEEAGYQGVVSDAELAPLADDLALLIVCNTFGAPANVVRWMEQARAHGVPLLVDSAPGLGATYASGVRQGGAGSAEVFSMHATKPFAIGEGGVITTQDPDVALRIKRMRNFGFDEDRVCQDFGMNAKLTEMQAAIACRVLDSLDGICAHRRARAADYESRLAPLGITFQAHGQCSAYQFMPVRLPAHADVATVRARLASAGIETRRYFAPALHGQPHFVNAERVNALPVTERLSQSMLSLPMSNKLTPADVETVCTAVAAAL